LSPDDSPESLLFVALGHPMRRMILREMVDEESLSPREVSYRIKKPLASTSYHVRILAKCEAIRLVDTKPVRGSMQHFYRFAIEASWACEALGVAPPPSAAG
jgi:DNA-binding transcriptional ArsR family regulator